MAQQSVSKVPQIRFNGFEGAWEELTLARAANFRRGSFPQPYGFKKWYGGPGAMPFVQVVDVNRNLSLVHKTKQQISKAAQPKSVFVEQGSVVVTLQGSIGRVAVLQYDAYVDRTLLIFRGYTKKTNTHFWAYLIQRKFDVEKQRAPGGTIKTITKEALSSFQVVFPDFTEQNEIGSYFKSLDRMIGLHQRKHDKLVTLKQAMLQKLFPQDGATTPDIRFKGFMEDWEEKTLSDIAKKVTDKNVSNEHSETFTNSAEFGIVSQRDYFDKDISNVANLDGYYVVEPDYFVYNPRVSTFAPCGPVNRNSLDRTGVMSPLYTVFSTHEVDTTFLEYFFKTRLWHPFMFLNGDTGARADRFSIKDSVFFEMPIPWPSPTEQEKIGNYFDSLDDLITKHTTQLLKLKNIKSACLEKMFV